MSVPANPMNPDRPEQHNIVPVRHQVTPTPAWRARSTMVRAGEIKDFTGVDAPYDAPERPGIVIDSETQVSRSASRNCCPS